MRTVLLGGASALAMFTICLAGPAVAADAAAGAAASSPSAASDATAIGELVVVAEKREGKLETTPVAISAYTAEQRDLLGIANVQDLSDYTPGLSYTSYSNRPYVRGVGRQTDNLAVESGVAVYVDGVFNGANASTILQTDSLFTDNIEVLRGPQSTLYGRNADGGAINYESRKPTKDFEAEFRTGYDNYQKYFFEGAMSGPITDWLRFRVGANYTEQDGGYYLNSNGQREGGSVAQAGNGNSYHIEAQFSGNIGDKIDFWTKVATSDYNVSFHTQTLLGPQDTRENYDALMPNQNYGLCGLPGGSAGLGCGVAGQDAIVPGSVVTTQGTTVANPSATALRNFDADFPSKSNEGKDVIVATNLVWHAPGFDVKYIFGFQSFAYNLQAPWLDYEGVSSGVESYALQGPSTPSGFCAAVFASAAAGCTQNLTVNSAHTQFTFDEYEHFYSHELSFSSTGNGKLQWLAGLYYYHEYYNQPINVVDASQAQVGAPLELFPLLGGAAVAAPLNPSRSVYSEYTQLNEDSVAAYAQADWQFTPTLKLTGGIRYSNDFKSGYEAFRLILFNLSGLGVGTFGANTPALDATGLDCTTTVYPGAGPCTISSTTGQGIRSLEGRWDAVTGTANLAWTPDSETLVYGKYSRGYKEGGFNSGILAVNPETASETVDAFELGAKKTVNRVFQVNADAFYYLYYNDQQPLGVSTGGVVSTQIFNIPEVHTYGVELESIWKPVRDLTLNLNYAYLSATVAQTNGICVEDTADPQALAPGANTSGCKNAAGAAIVLQNITGASIAEAPANKISIDALYEFRFETGNLTLAASYVWKDKEYSSPFNRSYNEAPAYSQVGLRATWTDIKKRYTVIAYAQNLFNTAGYDNAYGVPVTNPGPAQVIDKLVSLTAPRTFGIEFQYKFR